MTKYQSDRHTRNYSHKCLADYDRKDTNKILHYDRINLHSFKLKQYLHCFENLNPPSTAFNLKNQKKRRRTIVEFISENIEKNLHHALSILVINTLCLLNFIKNLIFYQIIYNMNLVEEVKQNPLTIARNCIIKTNKSTLFNKLENNRIKIKHIKKFNNNSNKIINHKNPKNNPYPKAFKPNLNLNLFALIIFATLISKINSKGLCGNVSSPQSVNECLPFSTQDYFCCLLTIEDSPSDFNTCYVVEKDTASSTVIQIGKITYKIDCSGIPDFHKYFPFEEKFTPCSTSNPKTISTCTDFEMENNAKCCLGIIKSYPDIRKCYSSIGLSANTINYTTSYGDEITLVCSGRYVNLFLFGFGKLHFMLFYVALFLIGLI